jgi:putative hydrolase of HD superfamily
MTTPPPSRYNAQQQIHWSQGMQEFENRIIDFFEVIHPLDRIARAGYVVRGVPHPENVSAHSHFLAVLVMLFLDEHPNFCNRQDAIEMALIHDLCEAKLMDIPMPYADKYLKDAKDRAEQAITEDLFDGFPKRYAQLHQDLLDAQTPEARIVRGLDKVQLLIKVLFYERERAGYLEEFWTHPANFRDYGLPQVAALFDAICQRAGRKRPQS